MKSIYLLVALGVCMEADAQADSTKIYTVVEQIPEFPGGDAALMQFITKNLNYPPIGRDYDLSSHLLVRFVVNEDGSVSDIEVKKSISPAIDAEAVRVIKKLPKFKPAYQDGKRVKVYFSLPLIIDFK